MEQPNETAEMRLTRLRTLAMNFELIEQEFREEVSHCHFCRGDMKGPCAWPFRKWMSCVNAHNGPDDVELDNPLCYKYVNGIIKCGNAIMEQEGGQRYLREGHLNWWMYAHMLQFKEGPCHRRCTLGDLDARPDIYLTQDRYKDCNECLLEADGNGETWHLAIQRRIETLKDWRSMANKVEA